MLIGVNSLLTPQTLYSRYSGFAMAFYMLLPMEKAFSSPISAIAKVFVMMLGEFQYEDYFPFEKVRKKSPI